MKEKSLGIILGYLSIFISFFVQFLFLPILLSLLGIETYGIYSLVLSLSAYLGLLNLGIMNSYFKYFTQGFLFKLSKKQINWHYLFLMILLGILTIIVSLIILSTNLFTILIPIEIKELLDSKLFFFVLTVKIAFSFPNLVVINYINIYEKFTFLKLINISKSLLNPLLIIILISENNTLFSIGLILLINEVLFSLIIFFFAKTKLGFEFEKSVINFNFLKAIFGFSSFILLSIITELVLWNSNGFIIAKKMDLFSVSLYAFIMLFIDNFKLLSTTISSVFTPKVYMLALNKDKVKLEPLVFKVGRIQFLLLFLFLSGFWFYGKYLIILWLGNDFNSIHLYLSILLSIIIIPLIQNSLIDVQKALDLYKFRGYLYFGFSILNLILTWFLIDYFGLMALIVSLSFTILIAHVFIMNLYNHVIVKINMILFWKNILKLLPLIFPALMFGITSNFMFSFFFPINKVDDIPIFILLIIAYSVIYIFTITNFGLYKEEKKEIINYLNKFLKKS